MNPYEHFDEWWDVFYETVRRFGYTGRVDRDSARDTFEQGEDPEDAAVVFYKEMSDPL